MFTGVMIGEGGIDVGVSVGEDVIIGVLVGWGVNVEIVLGVLVESADEVKHEFKSKERMVMTMEKE